MHRSSEAAKARSQTQNARLDPFVALGLLSALLFFGVSGAIAFKNLETLRDDNQKIIVSGSSIMALGQLLASLQDAETGQRGYLLTGNESYLGPYETALAAIPAQLADVAHLTRDNSDEQDDILALNQMINAKLGELKATITLRNIQGAAAALAMVNTNYGKNEMDTIRAQIAAMSLVEQNIRAGRVADMNSAYDTAAASSVLAGVLGIILTVIVGLLLRRAGLARARAEWLQAGEAGLAMAMLGDQTNAELGENLLAYLCRYLGAVAGAVFVRGEAAFEFAASYAVPKDAGLLQSFTPQEGLLGQAVRENRPLIIHDIPDGYLRFGSALGYATPRHLVIWPADNDGAVNSVLEFGFIRTPEDTILEYLTRVSAAIATAIRSAAYRAMLQDLLDETQRKSAELQMQSEELRVSNEELEEQSRALKESQLRLEQQQVELEQTNTQLEEQTRRLELQRDDLERANHAVQQNARELEQASQYKTDFLANMSHELRTPLNSLLILAKLLADNPEDNLSAEQIKYARTIQSSGNDLLRLINDILDLSKIEAGHVEMRAQAVLLEHLAGHMRQMFQPMAQTKGLTFSIAITPECPPEICTDQQRLEQILKNLLSNAFKFTEAGAVELRISPAAAGQVAFAVTDTGIGISEEQQGAVFEAFRQADGTISRKYGGTGLGLSISRELARLLGGAIELQSRLQQGSVFTLTIPVIFAPAVALARSVPSALPSGPPARSRVDDDQAALCDTERVLLIVEDDPSFSSILLDLSHEMGFRAVVAASAEEALRLARQYLPSAIILDVGLPDQSGLSVLDQLKRETRTRHIPIHVVSASDNMQTALALGAVGYMVKPVQREELVDILRTLEARLARRMHHILIVEDDHLQREAVGRLLRSADVETVTAGTAAECLERLSTQTFDCMVLDLSLPDASGYSLLETLSQEEAYSFPPVIVYTGRDLSADEEMRLRRYSRSIIIKGAKSPERLLDEVTLFLHRVVSELPDEQQRMIHRARNRDAILEGRRILVVEDDVRNVYALTNILEPRGAYVEIARNGQEALDVLAKSAAHEALKIDLVLMDVMMPVMDGLTATREIRKHPEWRKLPVITLTAKAMPDDQLLCIAAGANDYMAKPLEVDRLLSLVRVWMPR